MSDERPPMAAPGMVWSIGGPDGGMWVNQPGFMLARITEGFVLMDGGRQVMYVDSAGMAWTIEAREEGVTVMVARGGPAHVIPLAMNHIAIIAGDPPPRRRGLQ